MNISIDNLEILRQKIEDLLKELSESELIALEKALEDKDFDIRNMTHLKGFHISPNKRQWVASILKSLDKEEQFTLRLSLEKARSQKFLKTENLELCWTGPRGNLRIRRTEQAITELLTTSDEKIEFLGYYITPYAERLISLIEKKLKEGIEVMMIVNEAKEKEDLIDWSRDLKNEPTIYSWIGQEEGSTLHAKCVVSDDERAFIGSSNFTYHGMRKNLELGLVIKDKRTVDNIKHLIDMTKEKSKEVNLRL